MHKALTVWWYEVTGGWPFLTVSAVTGLVTACLPALPAYGSWSRGDVALAASLVGGVGLFLAGALGGGASVLAGPAARDREGFYLARPVGSIALWAGRMGAVETLTLAAVVLVMAPSLLTVARESGLDGPGLGWAVVVGGVLTAGLAALAALLRMGLAIRSFWSVGLLLTALAGPPVLLRAILTLLREMGAPDLLLVTPFLPFVAVAWSVALAVGSAVAAFSGRIDLRRGVKNGSAAAMGLLLVAASGLLLLAHRAAAVRPGDVDEIAVVSPVPNRQWLVLAGQVRRWSHVWWTPFLVDGASGRWMRLPRTPHWMPASAASGDGSVVAIGVCSGVGRPEFVALYRIPEGGDGLPERFATVPAEDASFLALSPSGSRLLVASYARVTVWEVGSGRPVAGGPVEEGRTAVARVKDDGVAILGRLIASEGNTWRFSGERIGGGGIEPVWASDQLAADSVRPAIHETGGVTHVALVLDHREGGGTVEVRRLDDGSLEWSAPVPSGYRVTGKAFSDEERLVVALKPEDGGNVRVLTLLTPGGEVWRRPYPGPGTVWITPGPGPGTALAATFSAQGWTGACLVDLENGSLRPLGAGFHPVRGAGGTLVARGRNELFRLEPDGTPVPVPLGS